MKRPTIALLSAAVWLSACTLTPGEGQDNRQGPYLISVRSEPNYVRTIPLPSDPSALVVIKTVHLETRHHLSALDLIRESRPRPYHGRLYLTGFSRTRIYADGTPDRPYRWIEPVGGRAYRYLYTGRFVAFRKDRNAEQASLRKTPGTAKSGKRDARIGARGPLGGQIIQEDRNSLTEVLPSGAYVFHPATELGQENYRYKKGEGWTKGH